jgi:hypothetical protein
MELYPILGLLFPERRRKWNRDPLFIRSRGKGGCTKRREKRKARRHIEERVGTGSLLDPLLLLAFLYSLSKMSTMIEASNLATPHSVHSYIY